MRTTGFLRTPIRADHQARMLSLAISEQPLSGNPLASDPAPQALRIIFTIDASTTEVQIAPLWEGMLRFFPNSTASYPTDPAAVTEANFASWDLSGDLVLVSTQLGQANVGEEASGFDQYIGLIDPVPSIVRYSPIVLTKDFLFTTLKAVELPVRLVSGGSVVTLDTDVPLWHEQLVLAFIQGKAGIWCSASGSDAASDFASQPMPSVKLQPAGSTTTLYMTIASRAAEVLEWGWFSYTGEMDGPSGTVLVDPALDTYEAQLYDPRHPGHSVISAGALYQNASEQAFVAEHYGSPLLADIMFTLESLARYRRIEFIRPEMPGTIVSAYPQRPFPQNRLCWRAADGTLSSQRLLLSGRLYLPLADGDYTFWAIPKASDPAAVTSGTDVKVSVQRSDRKYIDLGSGTVAVTVGSVDTSVRIYAHLLTYDKLRLWRAWHELGPADTWIKTYKAESEKRWNVEVLDWYFLFSAMADYAQIYAYVVASAGRHYLAPEFLQAVVMGEGLNVKITELQSAGTPYNDDEVIDSYQYLGLDSISTEITQLRTETYLDASFEASLSDSYTGTNEKGETVHPARVHGWEAAVELIAAELQWRKDKMATYCPSSGCTELEWRYLAYLRYNCKSWSHFTDTTQRLKKFTGTRPSSEAENCVYNSLRRIAISEWYEAARVYR